MKKTSKEHRFNSEPPCQIKEVNKPNLERMAKAFLRILKKIKAQ